MICEKNCRVFGFQIPFLLGVWRPNSYDQILQLHTPIEVAVSSQPSAVSKPPAEELALTVFHGV